MAFLKVSLFFLIVDGLFDARFFFLFDSFLVAVVGSQNSCFLLYFCDYVTLFFSSFVAVVFYVVVVVVVVAIKPVMSCLVYTRGRQSLKVSIRTDLPSKSPLIFNAFYCFDRH